MRLLLPIALALFFCGCMGPGIFPRSLTEGATFRSLRADREWKLEHERRERARLEAPDDGLFSERALWIGLAVASAAAGAFFVLRAGAKSRARQ